MRRIRIAQTKKKMLTAVLVSGLVVAVGFGSAFALGISKLKKGYEQQIDIYEQEIGSNQVTTYVAIQDIPSGTELSEEWLELRTVYFSGGNGEMLITEEDFGKIVEADIPMGEPIYASMIGDSETELLREREYACISLSTNLKQFDFVDIHIMYPNGEDYIVASKICLQKLYLSDNVCFVWLDAGQLSTLSSAIVDTYLHEGSLLYTARYIEDSHEASKVTYIPTKNCITAMANDANIVDKATLSLNASLRDALDARIAEVEANNSVDLKETISGRDVSEIENEEYYDDMETGDTVSEEVYYGE